MLKKAIFFIFLMASFMSCKKDEADYRLKYTGDFDFTVIEEFWMLGQLTQYDTIEFEGTIRLFTVGDENIDLYPDYDSLVNIDKRITVSFGENLVITPEITLSGLFIERSGYHYHHAGGFTTENQTNFVVEGLGGLGAGWNYQISGKRK